MQSSPTSLTRCLRGVLLQAAEDSTATSGTQRPWCTSMALAHHNIEPIFPLCAQTMTIEPSVLAAPFPWPRHLPHHQLQLTIKQIMESTRSHDSASGICFFSNCKK